MTKAVNAVSRVKVSPGKVVQMNNLAGLVEEARSQGFFGLFFSFYVIVRVSAYHLNTGAPQTQNRD